MAATLELGPGEEDYRAGISEPVFITSSLGPVLLTLGVLERSCEPQVEAACRCFAGVGSKSPSVAASQPRLQDKLPPLTRESRGKGENRAAN